MDNIHIILVEPVYAGNVASIARIMNNFEFSKLRIVGEMPTDSHFYMAVHSEHILDNVQHFDSLENALSDIDRAIAFSRRKGKLKKVDLIPSGVAEYIHTAKDLSYGLVFGRETYGLTDEEASLCPLRCYIKANPSFPSLNLSQAVAVILYEIYGYNQKQNAESYKYSKKTEFSSLIDYIMNTLENVGFDKSKENYNWGQFFENLFSRANLTSDMAYRIKQLFNRINVAVKGKGKGYH